jgi:hypothetical protein
MHTIQHLLSEIGTASWQDLTLSVGNIFFCVTLIPMLRRPERPPLLTCIPTGLALLAGGFVFGSLHLWLTALTQAITGLQWLALAVKRPPGGAPSLMSDSDESPGRTRRPGHRKWPQWRRPNCGADSKMHSTSLVPRSKDYREWTFTTHSAICESADPFT